METLDVQPVNVDGETVGRFDVSLSPTDRQSTVWIRDVEPGKTARFRIDWTVSAASVFILRVFPVRYRPVVKLVRAMEASKVEPVCPVDPERVIGFEFPEDLPEVPGLTWNALGDLQRAGFLNIYRKAQATPTEEGAVADLLVGVREVRQDRVFFQVETGSERIIHSASNSGLFERSPSALHEPPPGYSSGWSYKSLEAHGNLQISFFRGDPPLADIDVDENENGLAHLFDVIRHHVTGQRTHPVDIHQILRFHQDLPLDWSPVV